MINIGLKNIGCYFLVLINFGGLAQEILKPLNANLSYIYEDLKVKNTGQVLMAGKTMSTSLTIPFIEDFYYAPTSSYPDPNKWDDADVYINSGYPIAPPSIGVATFDGLNQFGFPYRPTLMNNNISLASDTLTSKTINLATTSSSQAIQLSDSLALSFYYQARGNGDPPELSDSLVLDFFSPGKNEWINAVWFALGNANNNINDTVFKRGFVKIDSIDYLNDGFKFRFRNYSAATGNYDHWHLDYVYLDKDRSTKGDTIYKDLAFAYVPTPFLRDYSAMPHEQYIASEMAPKNLVRIKNNGGTAINMTYEYKIDTASQVVHSYSGGAFVLGWFKKKGYDSIVPHATPPITYTFAAMPDSIDYRIKHVVFESGSPTDFIRANDTVVQYQRFRNYYAIDDGSAEAGYYINAASAKVAVKINVNVADSFLAVRIYFDPVATVATLTNAGGFRINVWPAAPVLPGATAMYTDVLQQPIFYNNVYPGRGFAEYKLQNQKWLQPGTYYIGIQQRADYLTLGFDMNTDHSATTYYDFGSGWTQSTEKGSVMIRPVFGKTLPPPPASIEDNLSENNFFSVFPNPASDQLIIASQRVEKTSYTIFNIMGQEVAAANLENPVQSVNTAQLHDGIYLLSLKVNNRIARQQKIIIQH